MIRVTRYHGSGNRTRVTVRFLHGQAPAGINRSNQGLWQYGDVIGGEGTLPTTARWNFRRAADLDRLWYNRRRDHEARELQPIRFTLTTPRRKAHAKKLKT